MAGSTFQTNPFDLYKLLEECQSGILQLPDFQRSWVWDEERIRSLLASISRSFPVGALMTLNSGGSVNFMPRPVEGAPAEAKNALPQSLLLDGQQRMTSMYQVTLRGKVKHPRGQSLEPGTSPGDSPLPGDIRVFHSVSAEGSPNERFFFQVARGVDSGGVQRVCVQPESSSRVCSIM